ncbi:hypothetical protein FZC76_20160 [Sutcliffiella horikoshii]|uniref:Uncharacterized protein n=1 Tax=Sutcliffiella horikoshii TaxID=79883 RepID=A0A5D4SN57_9BACI|nr:hypothetical protein [Sutcliffiella horikoshii]TYS63532.1 hypothetical protein FZC76_20160 [Sutcliffiella horikoshii]
MSKKYRYITLGIIAIIVFFSLKTFNDYRQRSLDDLINFNQRDFYSLGFIKDRELVPDNRAYEWMTEEKEPVVELMEFLSQYRIKKVSEDTFIEKINSEERFEFTINHSKANPAIVWVLENRVHILVGNYYEVVNGPIDMEWIKEYNNKYREKYAE